MCHGWRTPFRSMDTSVSLDCCGLLTSCGGQVDFGWGKRGTRDKPDKSKGRSLTSRHVFFYAVELNQNHTVKKSFL